MHANPSTNHLAAWTPSHRNCTCSKIGPRAPAVRDVVTLSKGLPLLLVATPSAEAREAAYPSSCAVTLSRPDMISLGLVVVVERRCACVVWCGGWGG